MFLILRDSPSLRIVSSQRGLFLSHYLFSFISACFATNLLTILHFPHQKTSQTPSLTPQPQHCRPIYSASLSDIVLKLSGMIDLNALYNNIEPVFITILLKSSLFPTIPLYLPQNLIFQSNFFSNCESRSDSPLKFRKFTLLNNLSNFDLTPPHHFAFFLSKFWKGRFQIYLT